MTQSGFTLLREKTTDREKENHGERKGDKDGERCETSGR